MQRTARVAWGINTTATPASIPEIARLAEESGFGEVWLSEDYFFNGGLTAAASVLAATRSISVGVGAVSVFARHPAVLAMETATLADLHPGRLQLGIGLGVAEWLHQMGLNPASPLVATREGTSAVRALLEGDSVDAEGSYFTFRGVQLHRAPTEKPPLFVAASGPKMLALSGEVADGTIASVLSGPRYVKWMRRQIAIGQERSGRTDPHRVVALALYALDSDSGPDAKDLIRDHAAFYLSLSPNGPMAQALGIADQLQDMVRRGGEDAAATIAREMPEEWLRELVIAGDADECATGIRNLLDAGADVVCLCAVADEEVTLARTAQTVLPLI